MVRRYCMSMLFSSELEQDLDGYDDGPMAISSSMKEDIEDGYDDYYGSSLAISSSMKEDLGICKKRYKNRIKYHDRKKI
jgi:hypothetical protein